MIELGNNAPDCREYVSNDLFTKGVSSDRLYWRTNFNLGVYGNICSFTIKGDRTPVFSIPNIELNAVQLVSFAGVMKNVKGKRNTKIKISPDSKYLYRGNINEESIHSLTGVQKVRDRYGLTGKGVRVAVIDDGIDYIHPALGGGFGPGFPVAYGYDLVGDDFDGSIFLATVPDDDPFENCWVGSHGTHVAGIIMADSNRVRNVSMRPPTKLTGAAPGIELGAYRIFGCDAETVTTDIIAAAIYKAAYDGSQIINLSLGGGSTHSDSIDSIACEDVGKLGHFCVSAIGNDGDSGSYTAGEPGTSKGGFGLGSAQSLALPSKSYISINGEAYYSTVGSSRPFPTTLSLAGIVVSNKRAEADNILNDGIKVTEDVKGKVVLVRWGPSSIGGSADRCDGVYNKGARACILYAHDDETCVRARFSDIEPLGRCKCHDWSVEYSAAISIKSKFGIWCCYSASNSSRY